MERVAIFDTTLRDGEQSPGATMTLDEKLAVAAALQALRVDVVEAGFPAASAGDAAAVRAVAAALEGPVVCALARCTAADVAAAAAALEPAGRRRIHVFLATSPIHRRFKLDLSPAAVVQRAVDGVACARDHGDDVEFSAEDAARTEPDFLAEVVERVIAAGATTVNLPDTVGYALPTAYAEMVRRVRAVVPNIGATTLSVHCHDDLGMATANSLLACEAGARQVECTINGIGERAGNCALEEVVMALRTRADALGLHCGVEAQRLHATSALVAQVTGIAVPRNKAVVGANAFAHEAGIHQHGMLKHHGTYEIMRPEDVGAPHQRLVLGKHSGRHALRARLAELGHPVDEACLQRLFEAFKRLADVRKQVVDDDLRALVERDGRAAATAPRRPN